MDHGDECAREISLLYHIVMYKRTMYVSNTSIMKRVLRSMRSSLNGAKLKQVSTQVLGHRLFSTIYQATKVRAHPQHRFSLISSINKDYKMSF